MLGLSYVSTALSRSVASSPAPWSLCLGTGGDFGCEKMELLWSRLLLWR